MSSVLKSFFVSMDSEDKRVIDYNEIIKAKVEAVNALNDNDSFETSPYYSENEGGEASYDTNDSDDYDDAENAIYNEIDDAGENLVSGNESEEPSVDMSAFEEQAGRILSTAESDAKAIISDAKEQAKQIMVNAREEGYNNGYKDGNEAAAKEDEKRNQAYEERVSELEAQYRAKSKEMEPVLVDTIVKVVMDVTHAISEENKELIVDIVNSVLDGNYISKNFLIRVSKEDALFLRDNKEKLIGATKKEINIDIVEDATMKKNDCIVETDFGVFDCSLDIQLENLTKEIRLLACAVGDEK